MPPARFQAVLGGKLTGEFTWKCASSVRGEGQVTSDDREARMTWDKLCASVSSSVRGGMPCLPFGADGDM